MTKELLDTLRTEQRLHHRRLDRKGSDNLRDEIDWFLDNQEGIPTDLVYHLSAARLELEARIQALQDASE